MNRKRRIIAIAGLAILLVAVLTVAIFLRWGSGDDILEVPLGVEEAVIVTAGPKPIEAAPFAWGVAVNVRIAQVREVAGGRVYDLRYIVNRAGDYDLRDYLRFADGSLGDGLPSFRVRGLERLSKDIEARIAETEEARVQLRSWYYETLLGLGIAWVGWLLLLVFWRRPRITDVNAVAAGPTLAEQIRAALVQFEAGSLDARQQAELELMIFRQWRQQRSWEQRTMAESLATFRADPEVADAYAELENWLHRPRRDASPQRVADAVRSQLKEPEPVVLEEPGA